MDICIKGARAICEAVGENPKQINFLVAELGLPAWRRGGAGSWRALPEDLKRWMLQQRNSHLPIANDAQAPVLTDCKGT
ncbi:MAG: hypothetical protein CVU73_15480 [Deltaproteobacteria bacterium HGW-Deltaproteobacteria-8]|nr:MAG: hypothetical protein CVU73_15480 [Deltaproteobacteria bacterium HGW-Deltaproteobacteria-8]